MLWTLDPVFTILTNQTHWVQRNYGYIGFCTVHVIPLQLLTPQRFRHVDQENHRDWLIPSSCLCSLLPRLQGERRLGSAQIRLEQELVDCATAMQPTTVVCIHRPLSHSAQVTKHKPCAPHHTHTMPPTPTTCFPLCMWQACWWFASCDCHDNNVHYAHDAIHTNHAPHTHTHTHTHRSRHTGNVLSLCNLCCPTKNLACKGQHGTHQVC